MLSMIDDWLLSFYVSCVVFVDGIIFCFVVSLVTPVSWSWFIEGESVNPRPPGSRLGKWESQSEKQRGG